MDPKEERKNTPRREGGTAGWVKMEGGIFRKDPKEVNYLIEQNSKTKKVKTRTHMSGKKVLMRSRCWG